MGKNIKELQWQRIVPVDAFGAGEDQEIWQLLSGNGRLSRSYNVRVTTGKPVDLLSFKPSTAKVFMAAVAKIRAGREKLFQKIKDNVTACPVCQSPTKTAIFRLNIYGGRYYQCRHCRHCFVMNRPSKQEVEYFYANDAAYHTTYTDKSILEQRIKQIAIPKAQWVIDQYKKVYGRAPRSILDIGAGAGHFVHACRTLGLKSEGVEVSHASRNFCREQFGFELDGCDITKDWEKYRGYDVITFWGVIEHVTVPGDLMSAAYNILKNNKGLVVCEIPHWNCMSTVLQTAFPQEVNRHLEPMGHINCFTETSAITVYEQNGFAPVAAWYYGMDVYELITHLLHQTKDDRLAALIAGFLNEAQYIFDRGRLSDTLIMAGVPLKRPVK